MTDYKAEPTKQERDYFYYEILCNQESEEELEIWDN